MVSQSCFTHTQDRATPECDLSGVWGSRESDAVRCHSFSVCFKHHSPGNKSDKLRGFGGWPPLNSSFNQYHLQDVCRYLQTWVLSNLGDRVDRLVLFADTYKRGYYQTVIDLFSELCSFADTYKRGYYQTYRECTGNIWEFADTYKRGYL